MVMMTKRFASMIAATSISILNIGGLSVSLFFSAAPSQAADFCQCVEYVKRRFGLSGAVGNAKDMRPALAARGFRQVSQPEIGAIAIFQPAFSQYTRVDQTYGHVGVISDSQDLGNQWKIRLLSSNSGGKTTDYNCNNVNDIWYKSYPKNTNSISYWVRGSSTVIPFQQPNVSSKLSLSVPTIDLTVTASNLSGKTVYVQMWRPAINGNPEKEWNNISKTATGTSITFNDLDGAGNTFSGVDYYTVASLSPIPSGEAARRRASCYMETNRTRLCDTKRR
jgi:surface antigen